MASVEGPYGTFPNPTSFDRVLMFAGGSGASFTVGTALNVIDKWEGKKPIDFHWMVRHRGEQQAMRNPARKFQIWF